MTISFSVATTMPARISSAPADASEDTTIWVESEEGSVASGPSVDSLTERMATLPPIDEPGLIAAGQEVTPAPRREANTADNVDPPEATSGAWAVTCGVIMLSLLASLAAYFAVGGGFAVGAFAGVLGGGAVIAALALAFSIRHLAASR